MSMAKVFNPLLKLGFDDKGSGAGVGSPVSGGTSGSVLFVDSSGNLTQDNAGFFYTDSTNQLNVVGGNIKVTNNNAVGLGGVSAFITIGGLSYTENTFLFTTQQSNTDQGFDFTGGSGATSFGTRVRQVNHGGTSTGWPLKSFNFSMDTATHGGIWFRSGTAAAHIEIAYQSSTTVHAYSSSVVPLEIKGAASQSANLLNLKDSSGTVLTAFGPAGKVGIGLTTSKNPIVDIVVGTGDGTVNESSGIRLRSGATDGAGFILQMGVSTTGVGGANQGYGFIQGGFWGGSQDNPLWLQPKAGQVAIGEFTGVHDWRLALKGTMCLKSPTQTNGDIMGKLAFAARDYAGEMCFIHAVFDQANWYQGAGLAFGTIVGADVASLDATERMRITGAGDILIGGTSLSGADISFSQDGTTVFNQQGNDADFRIEGDTISNLFVVDAGLDQVQIGNHVKLASVAGITTEGTMWNDSTQKAVQIYEDGIEQTLSSIIFVATANATANSATETSIIGTGVGTTTLPANFFVAGKTLRIRVWGFATDSIMNGAFEIKLKLGSTVIATTGSIQLPASSSTTPWELTADITCRTTGASGTVFSNGSMAIQDNATSSTTPYVFWLANTSADTIDTTGALAVGLTSTSSNDGMDEYASLTSTNFSLEVLN